MSDAPLNEAAPRTEPSIDGRATTSTGDQAGATGLELVVYTAHGCCLCDDAREALDRIGPELELPVSWVHIDGHPELEATWREQLPAGVLAGRKVFKYRVDEALLRRRVAELRR